MLTLSHISKTFNPGTVNEKKALTDLSLHLDAGDFVTIIGSNGAGKSTLFNAVSGSFFVDEGSMRKIWRWPRGAGAGSPTRPGRTARGSGTSWPCWAWGWRTG